jgi:hypothetical protein
MSSLPARTEIKTQFMTIPQAVNALARMEAELDSAKSYEQIRKLADAAEALKLLFRDVKEVKDKAELVVLTANARIGEEIKRGPKASGSRRKILRIQSEQLTKRPRGASRKMAARASKGSPPSPGPNSRPSRRRSRMAAAMRR